MTLLELRKQFVEIIRENSVELLDYEVVISDLFLCNSSDNLYIALDNIYIAVDNKAKKIIIS